MISIRKLNLLGSKAELATIPEGKVLINTINAFSYNNARKDALFEEALMKGDYLIPDGASIVKACRWLRHTKSKPKERIAGWDLFSFEMERLNKKGKISTENPAENPSKNSKDDSLRGSSLSRSSKSAENPTENQGENLPSETLKPSETLETGRRPKVMFMGSSEKVLAKIVEQAAKSYPNLEVVTYSPPYKPEFTAEDNAAIIKAINDADPDLLWIGMTAPKQEKWTYSHWQELNIHCHVGTVGAVFDFFAGTYKRAPQWWQDHSLEWLYRLLKEPRRMWRRYIIGNARFLWLILREKLGF